jgi:3-dehydrotetronate 4-kinase
MILGEGPRMALGEGPRMALGEGPRMTLGEGPRMTLGEGPRMTLGVIADDFTGATDIASMLVRAGLRTVQVIGVPQAPPPEADAVVVALKTRTVPAIDAVRESLAVLRWLQTGGMRQCYFKYCSTFDSTAAGNIGPVSEALMDALAAPFTIACPAFPENGRTVFRGHLFVGDALLSDSGMREHPLTPMTDSNLVRVLQAQTTRRVGLLRHDVIAQGVAATRARIEALKQEGHAVAIADALSNADLHTLAAACAEWPLVTAGSGLALGLGAVYAERGWLVPDAGAARLAAARGRGAVIAGSCSVATRGQVARWRESGQPAFAIDARALARGEPVAAQALAWARGQATDAAVLIHATTSPSALQNVQAEFGAMRVGALVETCLAEIAVGLVAAGVRRLIVAGGETSGAVVQALGITRLRIGPAICAGVPWTQAEGLSIASPLHLALKSGNFGSADFFDEAFRLDPSV